MYIVHYRLFFITVSFHFQLSSVFTRCPTGLLKQLGKHLCCIYSKALGLRKLCNGLVFSTAGSNVLHFFSCDSKTSQITLWERTLEVRNTHVSGSNFLFSHKNARNMRGAVPLSLCKNGALGSEQCRQLCCRTDPRAAVCWPLKWPASQRKHREFAPWSLAGRARVTKC